MPQTAMLSTAASLLADARARAGIAEPVRGPLAQHVDDVAPIAVGAGCWRRDLPAPPGLRMRMIELAPGAQWPRALQLETGASFYVAEGELVDGETRHPAGTHLRFAPDSRHRPSSERGARVLVVSPNVTAFLAAGGSPDAIAHHYHPTEG